MSGNYSTQITLCEDNYMAIKKEIKLH